MIPKIAYSWKISVPIVVRSLDSWSRISVEITLHHWQQTDPRRSIPSSKIGESFAVAIASPEPDSGVLPPRTAMEQVAVLSAFKGFITVIYHYQIEPAVAVKSPPLESVGILAHLRPGRCRHYYIT